MRFPVCVVLLGALGVSGQSCDMPGPYRVDCGYVGIDQEKCVAKGCCWEPINPNPSNYPWCFNKGNPPVPVVPPPPVPMPSQPYTEDEISKIFGYFNANINVDGSGAVVASPSKSNPDYFYHWMRDGSLSMREYMNWQVFTNTSTSTWHPVMDSWVKWVRNVQTQSDPNGQSVLDEPKFMIPSGAVYSGGWCRPQNDGPALRATTMAEYALKVMSAASDGSLARDVAAASNATRAKLLYGDGNKRSVHEFVSSTLWPLVQTDMDFVLTVWNTETCDLWEEVRSNSFFWNLVSFRRGAIIGAQLATAVGQQDKASQWQAFATKMERAITQSHWNGQYIVESDNRPLDSSVLCGLNHNHDLPGGFLPVTDSKVTATIQALETAFNTAFPINGKDSDLPGALVGRYPGDHYYNGNPWILLSQCLAEVRYLRAAAAKTQGDMEAHADEMQKGDGTMLRVKRHIASDDLHMSEQIDKNTGSQLSAHDLTWSYGTFFAAIRARAQSA
eukprot:TRINITY_DN57584_c0_g1_i1.p1 TRINITY_DN57584_c0_g1~~TRINITY_DN57584_c0_g1_i1.p1  ORF type:complete len:512 (+),score=89.60 TRINITY_DN57584_c0_g1_i1:36-1538(+)